VRVGGLADQTQAPAAPRVGQGAQEHDPDRVAAQELVRAAVDVAVGAVGVAHELALGLAGMRVHARCCRGHCAASRAPAPEFLGSL